MRREKYIEVIILFIMYMYLYVVCFVCAIFYIISIKKRNHLDFITKEEEEA